MANKTCGIYKITSPSNRIYIGQSVFIERRFDSYKKLRCKNQPLLYNSFLKYGVDKHKFEILCGCEESEMNEKERFYQDLYCVTNKSGLNCMLTKSGDRSGSHNQEIKDKKSKALKGRIPWNKGLKTPLETIEKMRISSIPASILRRGRKASEETRKKLSIAHKGRPCPTRKLVLNTQTGIFYDSADLAYNSVNLKFKIGAFTKRLHGETKNNTPFIYA